MATAGRSAVITLFLLGGIIYAFALVFVQALQKTEPGRLWFRHVPMAMSTLLLHGCFGEELPTIVKAVGAFNEAYAILLVLFTILASLIVLNMLVAVLVEAVQVVASVEKERLVVTFVHDKLQKTLLELDKDHDNMISR